MEKEVRTNHVVPRSRKKTIQSTLKCKLLDRRESVTWCMFTAQPTGASDTHRSGEDTPHKQHPRAAQRKLALLWVLSDLRLTSYIALEYGLRWCFSASPIQRFDRPFWKPSTPATELSSSFCCSAEKGHNRTLHINCPKLKLFWELDIKHWRMYNFLNDISIVHVLLKTSQPFHLRKHIFRAMRGQRSIFSENLMSWLEV